MSAPHPPTDRAYRLIAARMLPLFLFGLLLMQIDRTNISFAALEMNRALGVTAEAFGLASGIFFVGYALFEVPSNLILERVSADKWLGGLLIIWGLVGALQAFAANAAGLVVLRFLLGVAEGGFLPGILFLLTKWLPATHRGRALGIIMLAPAVSAIIGGPIAGALLQVEAAGLVGWHWLFIIEGGITVLYGIAFMVFVPRGPEAARWLSESDRTALVQTLAAERAGQEIETGHVHRFMTALRTGALWTYAGAYFMLSVGIYGITFWLPQILKSGFPGASSLQTGFLSAIPWACAVIVLIAVVRMSDRTGDRRWHLALFGVISALGLVLSILFGQPIIGFVALCVALSCATGYLAVFWASPMTVLSASALAGGIALINSIGNLGGFAGPYIAGVLAGSTHNFVAVIGFFAAALLLAGVIPFLVPKLFPNARKVVVQAVPEPANTAPAGGRQ
jgi:MFS transporter, ACS family, tartrate transporter